MLKCAGTEKPDGVEVFRIALLKKVWIIWTKLYHPFPCKSLYVSKATSNWSRCDLVLPLVSGLLFYFECLREPSAESYLLLSLNERSFMNSWSFLLCLLLSLKFIAISPTCFQISGGISTFSLRCSMTVCPQQKPDYLSSLLAIFPRH